VRVPQFEQNHYDPDTATNFVVPHEAGVSTTPRSTSRGKPGDGLAQGRGVGEVTHVLKYDYSGGNKGDCN
jgi:hypothetical protein